MMRDNIFLEDVEVPEIVQQKADRVFSAIQAERSFQMSDMVKKEQNERKGKMRKGVFAKRLAVTAACMAAVVAAGALAGSLKGVLGTSGTGAEDALLTAVDQIDKIFTLQVKAAGAKEGEMTALLEGDLVPVTVNDGKADSWVFGGEEDRTVNYCINIPKIICEGDQIESVTYSINNGAFQIVQPEDMESIVTDGQFYDVELNTGSIGGEYKDIEESKDIAEDGRIAYEEPNAEDVEGTSFRAFETFFYKSFTLDYDRQSDEDTWINICNECPDSKEVMQLIWNEENSEEKYNSGVQKMLDDTVITCMVNYKDNTSQSVDIKVNSCVMTRREAGEPLNEGIDPEEKMMVITFELQ